jgi:hypothetical protein
MLKNAAEHERDISKEKVTAISLLVSPASLTGVFAVTVRELWWMNQE